MTIVRGAGRPLANSINPRMSPMPMASGAAPRFTVAMLAAERVPSRGKPEGRVEPIGVEWPAPVVLAVADCFRACLGVRGATLGGWIAALKRRASMLWKVSRRTPQR
jgi:hypothetical protein